jgi:heat-inducible transcriptional repressor
VEELNSRQQMILGLVVREHVSTAAPVGSKGLADKFKLGVSSATIRNELARLEEMGYLTHPHTSAGRLPTEKGYRYFVERLMGDSELPLDERRTIAHQFHQVQQDVEQWMRLAAAVLARTARNAALITAPQASRARFKHVQLISTHGQMVLLILVLQDGSVKQEMLTLAQTLSQESLDEVSRRVNNTCENLSAEGIATLRPTLPAFEAEISGVLADILQQTELRTTSPVYRDGLAEVLKQPEFERREESETLLRVMEAHSSVLEEVLANAVSPYVGGVQVVIGGEGRWQELRDYSLVLARYGVPDQATGALGVLGPTRMPYGRAISAVRYVADLMSDLISDLYSPEEVVERD